RLDPAAGGYARPGDRQRPRWESQPPLEAILRDWGDGQECGRSGVSHDAKGEARVALPGLAPGAYRLRYETADDFGGKFETTKDFVVAGRRTPLKVAAVLLAESSTVSAGGVARFLALSGIPGQELSLELYRDGELTERRRIVAPGPSLIEIPVGEKDRGGFGVRLAMVRDHQFVAVAQTVFVPWDDRRLDLSFSTFRDRIRPGARETWRLSVRSEGSRDPEGLAAEILASMYDRSLDAFRSHVPADPLSVYPNRASVAGERASIGPTFAQWVSNEGYGNEPAVPMLRPDRLKFLEGYGLGGPGRRRGIPGPPGM